MKEYGVNKVKNEWMKKGMVGWEKEYMEGCVKEERNEMMNEGSEEYKNGRTIEWMNGGRKSDEVTEEGKKGWKKEILKKDSFVELELMKGLGWMMRVRINTRIRVFRIDERVRVNGEG